MRKVSNLLRAAKNAGVGVHARRIWVEHPYLKDVTESVVDHFSEFSIENGKALVEAAILNAVSAYVNISKNFPEESPQPNYLAALFEEMAKAGKASAQNGPAAWKPCEKQCFSEFAGSGSVKYKSVTRNDHSKMRGTLMKHFLDDDTDAVKTVCQSRMAMKWVKHD